MRSHSLRSICVYCGSHTGTSPEYTELAEKLGDLMAELGISLVYGAGSVGLMGVLARRVLDRGGSVTGIIPEHLDDVEIVQDGLTEVHVTANMHDRKMLMFERSDAFIVLPGGLGTLDEMFEMITWAQLGLHRKPVFVYNHKGYWKPFIDLVDHVIDHGFAQPAARSLFTVIQDFDDLRATLDVPDGAVNK